MAALKFLVFSDFHYKKKMYPASVKNLQTILDRAESEGVDFVMHCGDFSNDYLGSPEITRAYLENSYGLPVFGVYGNHELETMPNSMQNVTPCLTNRKNEVVFGTEDGKIGDGSVAYYYYDVKEFRIIYLDTNYSLTPEGEFEHNRTGSYTKPAENTRIESLGDKQLCWLRSVLIDAAEKNLGCVVVSHSSFSGIWGKTPDSLAVREIYREVNSRRQGTVLMSLNGHYHSNHVAKVEDVLYFDVHTAINGWWQSKEFNPYHEANPDLPVFTFDFTDYDREGNPVSTVKMPYSALVMGKKSLFFSTPLSAVVTISAEGDIIIDGAKTQWEYGIAIEPKEGYEAEITSYPKEKND